MSKGELITLVSLLWVMSGWVGVYILYYFGEIRTRGPLVTAIVFGSLFGVLAFLFMLVGALVESDWWDKPIGRNRDDS